MLWRSLHICTPAGDAKRKYKSSCPMSIYLNYEWIPSYFIPWSLNSEVRKLKKKISVEEKSKNNHCNIVIINQDTVKLCNGRSRLLYWYTSSALKKLMILGLLHIIKSRFVKNQPICITTGKIIFFFFKEVSRFVFMILKHFKCRLIH